MSFNFKLLLMKMGFKVINENDEKLFKDKRGLKKLIELSKNSNFCPFHLLYD